MMKILFCKTRQAAPLVGDAACLSDDGWSEAGQAMNSAKACASVNRLK